MEKHEYYKLSINLIPQEVIYEYNFMENKINGFPYVRVEKGIYGLVQAVIIALMALKEHLRPFGYEPVPINTVLWCHNKNGITINLVVDNLGIKYQRKEDTLHLIHVHQEKYEITQDWTGSLYIGIALNWYYKAGILDISMPGHVKGTLHKCQHPTTSRPQHSPHQCNFPNYGFTSPKLVHQAPKSPKLSPPDANTVQYSVGTFLYYTRAVDPTMLVALKIIIAEK